MKRRFYILAFLPIWFVSCINDFEPRNQEDSKRQIVLECELAPGVNPKAVVHFTGSIDRKDPVYYPSSNQEAKVTLITPMDEERMGWSPVENAFILQSIEIQEGESYEIVVEAPTFNVEKARAITTVPLATEIGEIELIDSPISLEGNDVRRDLVMNINIPSPDDPTCFYQLVPSLLNPNLMAQGIEQYDAVESKFIEILSNQNALTKLIHKNGIFIDNSKLQSDAIDIKLTFLANVDNYELIDHVMFSLKTINTESMMYHDQTDRELRLASLPLDEPLTSMSNIENGHGLFGAYSASTVIFDLD